MANNIPIWLLLQLIARNNATAAAATTSTSQTSGGGTSAIDTPLKLGMLVLMFMSLFLAGALILRDLNDCEDIGQRPSAARVVVASVCVAIDAALILYIKS